MSTEQTPKPSSSSHEVNSRQSSSSQPNEFNIPSPSKIHTYAENMPNTTTSTIPRPPRDRAVLLSDSDISVLDLGHSLCTIDERVNDGLDTDDAGHEYNKHRDYSIALHAPSGSPSNIHSSGYTNTPCGRTQVAPIATDRARSSAKTSTVRTIAISSPLLLPLKTTSKGTGRPSG